MSEVKWNVKENDLDGMKVYYKEINGETGYIVDIFNDGLTAQLKIGHDDYILIPTVQLQTMNKEYIVDAEDVHNCDNCDIRLYDFSDGTNPVYVAPNKCKPVCNICVENDDIYFLCDHCGEWNKGEKCFNCGKKR